MSRIREVAAQGSTVIFVSHSMDAVAKICAQALLLDAGETLSHGSSEKVVQEYTNHMQGRIAARYLADDEKAAAEAAAAAAEAAQGDETAVSETDAEEAAAETEPMILMKSVELLNKQEAPCRIYQTGDSMTIRIEYEARCEITDCIVGVGLDSIDGVNCYGPNTRTDDLLFTVAEGVGHFDVTFDPLLLLADTYTVAASLYQGDTMLQFRDNLCRFIVEDEQGERGAVRIPHRWTHVVDGAVIPPRLAQDTNHEGDTPSPATSDTVPVSS